MKKIKKIAVIMFVLVLLVACGKSDDTTSSANSVSITESSKTEEETVAVEPTAEVSYDPTEFYSYTSTGPLEDSLLHARLMETWKEGQGREVGEKLYRLKINGVERSHYAIAIWFSGEVGEYDGFRMPKVTVVDGIAAFRHYTELLSDDYLAGAEEVRDFDLGPVALGSIMDYSFLDEITDDIINYLDLLGYKEEYHDSRYMVDKITNDIVVRTAIINASQKLKLLGHDGLYVEIDNRLAVVRLADSESGIIFNLETGVVTGVMGEKIAKGLVVGDAMSPVITFGSAADREAVEKAIYTLIE